MSNILAIPDLHHPFTHKDALSFCLEIQQRFQTNLNVCMGDELDFHAVSNYTADADGFSAGHELDRAIRNIEPWTKAFPDMLICHSNHTMRPWIRMSASGLPRKLQPKLAEVIGAPPGWIWKDAHILRCGKHEIVFEHGHAAHGGQFPYASLAKQNMMSTVIGHHHGAFGIYWHRTPYKLIFGMGLGCLFDEDAYAHAYGRNHKTKPILGAGVIQDGTPILVKMPMTKAKRWNGKLGIEMVPPPRGKRMPKIIEEE